MPEAVTNRQVTVDAVEAAARSVYAAAIRTPLIRVDLPEYPVQTIYLKLELLQPIGSFKIRGAFNAMSALSADTLAGGVWTVSAGNAALGVAFAARQLGAPCSVLVMETAPATKIRAIERLGARIVLASYDECWDAVVAHRSPRMHGHFVHPFDDDRFIAGNGTVALEILSELPEVGAIVAPLGGGGLLAGIRAVLRARRPETKLYAAEPATAAPLAASLSAGAPRYFDGWTSSFVDGAGGKSVLETMWPLLRDVSSSVVVSLDDAAEAMRIVAERAHLIIEGAAACAVAAALSGKVRSDVAGGPVVAVVSGGNIDLPRFAALVGACSNR